ncbi:ABC transporter permease, partial [Acidisphaera rubrifaciens]
VPSPLLVWLSPPLAVAATIAVSAAIFAVIGSKPAQSVFAFFVSPLLSTDGLAELALKAGPLAMIGVGLAAGFRANVWNIGAEGQLTLGAIAGGGIALAFYGQDGWWILPLMCLAGVTGGMAWAAIPAFLRTRFGVNEILVSLLLTYVASLLLTTLVFGPWKDPDGFNFPQSRMFSDAEVLPPIIEGTRLGLGTVIAFIVPVLVGVVMRYSIIGFRLRAVGLAPAAARYAGFSERRVVWLVMLAGGGLAGLAGVFEVAGPIGQLIPQITPGYGFTAIIVAYLGRLHPLGIIPAALIVALSYLGGEAAQVQTGLPKAATGVVQGMLLFFLLASDFLARYRVTPVRRPRVAAGAASTPAAAPVVS